MRYLISMKSPMMISKTKKFFFRAIKFILVFTLQLIIIAFFVEFSLRAGAFIWKNIYRFNHRNDKDFYIYVIGESTSWGVPFGNKISFPKIVSYMFDNKIHNKYIKIINLAIGGRNIEYEYWKLFNELLIRPNSDGILLIYAGINDAVGINSKPDPTFGRWRFMQTSIILSKLQYLLEGMICDNEGGTSNNFLFNFFGLKNSLGKYEYRLRKIITLTKSYNLKVVISTLVGNIAQFNPQDNSVCTSEGALKLFNLARSFEDQGEFKTAMGIYENIVEKFNTRPLQIYHHLGKCYEGLQIYDKAREYYWKAIDAGDPARPNHWRNKAIIDLAKEYNIGLVDALKIFEDNSPYGLIGYNLFVDAHHPNLEGYILLGSGFTKEMEKLLGEKAERQIVTGEEILNHFDFKAADFFEVYMWGVWWLCLESVPVCDREERLKIAEYYLKKAEEIKITPEIYFWYFILASLRNDKEKTLYWLEKGKLLTENRVVFYGRREMFKMFKRFGILEDVLPENISNEIIKLAENS